MSGRRARLRVAAGVAAALLTSVALIAHGGVVTDASWTDREVAHGAVGTVDCAAADGDFAARGEGRLLSGSLLGIDLDRIAAVEGIVVTNDGTRSRPDTANGEAAPAPHAYADPLSVEALSAVHVSLPGVLQLPLDTDLGVVGQYAQATSGGIAVGAAGSLTSSGGIALDPDGDYPDLATLHVSELLRQINPSVATALAGVADVSITAGAVTGRAAIDGCAHAWSGATSAVTRDYLASSLRTDITSPTVGALVLAVESAVVALQRATDGIGASATVRSGITAGLTSLVEDVLGSTLGVRLGSVSITELSASVDLSGVRSLVSRPFGDPGGVVVVDPTAGTVSVDSAALLAAAYPGRYSDGLNGQAPNTDLLSDPAILTALTTALGAASSAWIADVEAALVTAIDEVRVSAGAEVRLQVSTGGLLPIWLDVATIDVQVDGSLGDLLAGVVPATARLELLGTLSGLLTALLGDLVDALVGGFGGVVGTTVDAALSALGVLPTATTGLAADVADAVSTVYSTLFLSQVVAVTVNAQNAPASGDARPRDWASLADGRYDVAALRIGVLGALGAEDARLYLGRGSVGPGCVLAQAPLPCAGY